MQGAFKEKLKAMLTYMHEDSYSSSVVWESSLSTDMYVPKLSAYLNRYMWT